MSEAIMFCLDNSEWMRNGDYSTTRLFAQAETVNELARYKTDANNETVAGVLSMAGSRVTVIVAPTKNLAPLLKATRELQASGTCNFTGALKTAQLALKNRPNKNSKQRIVFFVGSPVTVDEKELVDLGKQLKKNSIAVDVVHFAADDSGADTGNSIKLAAFLEAVNANGNSQLLNVPPGPHVLSDLVMQSPIVREPGSGNAARAGGGAPAGADADLAAALAASRADAGMGAADEDEAIQAAIRASMAEFQPAPKSSSPLASPTGGPVSVHAPKEPPVVPPGEAMDDDDDEEAEMAKALALSLAPAAGAAEPAKMDEGGDVDAALNAALQDQAFLDSLLDSVQGGEGATKEDLLDQLIDKPKDKKDDADKQ